MCYLDRELNFNKAMLSNLKECHTCTMTQLQMGFETSENADPYCIFLSKCNLKESSFFCTDVELY